MDYIPTNPDKLNHKNYTYLEIELAEVLNNIWFNNRLFITKEDIEILKNFSKKCENIEIYKRMECDFLDRKKYQDMTEEQEESETFSHEINRKSLFTQKDFKK